MIRQISAEGIKFIAKHEGFRANAYPDPGSKDGTPWTIGYGHTKGVKKGDKVTRAEAERLLKQDIAWAEREVNKLNADLNQSQYDALVSFTFNVGAAGARRSSAFREAKRGRHDLVPGKLMLWIKNDGKVMQGLINRRTAEAKLYAAKEPVGSRNVAAAPVRGKPITESRTAALASGQGLAGVAVAVSYGAEIKENTVRMTEGLDFSSLPVILGAFALAGVLLAGWFVYDRYQKTAEDGA